MKKELSIGKILIAGMLFACAIILAYLGVMAYKKSMYINLRCHINPEITCELYFKKSNNYSFDKIFSNVRGQEMVASGMWLDPNTSTLSLNSSFNGGLGAGFFLKVKSYTPEKVLIESTGTGVAYDNMVLGEYGIAPNTETEKTLTVVSVTDDITIKFTKVEQVLPTFTATQFDLTATGTTITECDSNYYTPIGVNMVAKLIPTNTEACPDVYALSSNGTSRMTVNGTDATIIDCQYYNYLTQTLTLPSALVNGDIALTSSIYWDGNATSAFADGTGTQAAPFIIATPKHFAHLSKGTGITNNCYFSMTKDLYMSKYRFAHDEASGTIRVISDLTDETACVVGTGFVGTSYNTTTATTMGTTYTTAVATNTSGTLSTMTASLPSDLTNFKQISYSTAILNGNNHTIFNYYSNDGSLFNICYGLLENLSSRNGFAFKRSGITLHCATFTCTTNNGKFYNLKNYSIVMGLKTGNWANTESICGGISGGGGGLFINCENYGYIFGDGSYAAGIVSVTNRGSNVKIINCVNYGQVHGVDFSVAGICGNLRIMLANGVAETKNCFNVGYIYGMGGSVGSILGGIRDVAAVVTNNHYISGTAYDNTNVRYGISTSDFYTNASNQTITACTSYANTGTAKAPNCTDANKIAIMDALNAYATANATKTVTYNGQTYDLKTWTRDTNNIINNGFPYLA